MRVLYGVMALFEGGLVTFFAGERQLVSLGLSGWLATR
jgi:hypothetical protein